MKKIIIAAGACLLLTACGKNEVTDTAKTALTTGTWKMTACSAYFVNPPSDTTTLNLFGMMLPCGKDNFYIFKTDNTSINDEGSLKCSSSDPQQKTSTWTLLNDNTMIRMTDPVSDTTVTADILTLNSSTLEVRHDIILAGMKGVATTTYTH